MSGGSWTAADLRRISAPLEWWARERSRTIRFGRHDEGAAAINHFVTTRGLEIVLHHFDHVAGGCYPGVKPAEVRALAKLRARLAGDGCLPACVVVSRVPLLAELLPEPAPVAVAAEPAAPAGRVADLERDARAVAFNVADTVARGELLVVRGDSLAFETDLEWGDVGQRVGWVAWARRAATGLGCREQWDLCAPDQAKHEGSRGGLRRVWSTACEREPLPSVLDLRRIFDVRAADLPGPHVREPLAQAIKRSPRGLVLIVDCEPWALARILDAGG